jgi:hypothetical protein
MALLIGMAGLAEAAWATMIGLLCIGTFIVAVLAMIALVFRSRIAAAVSLMVDLVVAWFLYHWEAFKAGSNDDPDWQSLLSTWRNAAGWWIAVSVAAVICALWIFWKPRRQKGTSRIIDPNN